MCQIRRRLITSSVCMSALTENLKMSPMSPRSEITGQFKAARVCLGKCTIIWIVWEGEEEDVLLPERIVHTLLPNPKPEHNQWIMYVCPGLFLSSGDIVPGRFRLWDFVCGDIVRRALTQITVGSKRSWGMTGNSLRKIKTILNI